jgi:single-strand DNA-binding protein
LTGETARALFVTAQKAFGRILAANVGNAPETRITQGGTKITSFSLTASRPKRDSEGKVLKDEQGRRVDDTEWHRITCFNGVAKSVADNVEKGQKLKVTRRIHCTRWTDQQQVERFGVEITAKVVTFFYTASRGSSWVRRQTTMRTISLSQRLRQRESLGSRATLPQPSPALFLVSCGERHHLAGPDRRVRCRYVRSKAAATDGTTLARRAAAGTKAFRTTRHAPLHKG